MPNKNEDTLKTMEGVKAQILKLLELYLNEETNRNRIKNVHDLIVNQNKIEQGSNWVDSFIHQASNLRNVTTQQLIDNNNKLPAGALIEMLLKELGVKKIYFAEEVGLGVTNLGYLSGMLKGVAPITRKNAERFSKWFESRGIILPAERLVQKIDRNKSHVD